MHFTAINATGFQTGVGIQNGLEVDHVETYSGNSSAGMVEWDTSLAFISFFDSLQIHNANSSLFDSIGNSFVLIHYTDALELSGQSYTSMGGMDLLLIKYDTSGNILWAQSFGSTEDDLGTSIATDADGNILITGQMGQPSANAPQHPQYKKKQKASDRIQGYAVLTVCPSPATTILNYSISNPQPGMYFTISNDDGKIVIPKTTITNSTGSISIDSLAAGSYYMTVFSVQGFSLQTGKFTVVQ